MKRRLRKPLAHTKVRPFTIYLPEELDTWLRREAEVQDRTLTAQTVRVLQAGRLAMAPQEEEVA